MTHLLPAAAKSPAALLTALGLLGLAWTTAAPAQTIRDYREVDDPQGPHYYAPVTYAGAPYTGTLVDRRADGRVAAWKQIADGRADGLWLEWYPDGALRYRGAWRAGYQEGEQVYYHPNGLPRERSRLRRGKLEGPRVTYARDGRVVQRCGFLADTLAGPCVTYGELPPVADADWPEESSPRATVVETWPDGRPKLWREEDAGGRPDGRWLEWTEDGVLRYRAGWRRGLGEGVWTYYTRSGALRQFGVYRADTLVGPEWQREADSTIEDKAGER